MSPADRLWAGSRFGEISPNRADRPGCSPVASSIAARKKGNNMHNQGYGYQTSHNFRSTSPFSLFSAEGRRRENENSPSRKGGISLRPERPKKHSGLLMAVSLTDISLTFIHLNFLLLIIFPPSHLSHLKIYTDDKKPFLSKKPPKRDFLLIFDLFTEIVFKKGAIVRKLFGIS